MASNTKTPFENLYKPPDGKIDVPEFVNYLKENTPYLVSNGNLYLWDQDHRCFLLMRRMDIPPWIISKIDKSVSVPSSAVNEVTKHLIWAPERQKNLESLRQNSQFYINANNGVIDIRDGKFCTNEEAEKLALNSGFTYQLDFSYNSEAKMEQAQAFQKFVETSLDSGSDPDKLNLLLEIIGICISSVMIARKFYFFVGATKSGKSVIADLIQSVVFPETSVTAFGLNQLGARFNTQHLEYSRINICRELTAGKLTGTDILKMLVSDEPLFVEGKGKERYVAHIHTKLLTCANQMPLFGEMDAAGNQSMTDRMVVLRFNHTISENEMDRHLPEKLHKERDIIFSLAVKALMELHGRDYIFTAPSDTRELMQSYLHESRSLALFIEERCQMSGEVHISVFIEVYKKFCTKNALVPYKNNEISAYIANCFPAVRKEKFRIDGKYLWGWRGISLSADTINNKEEKQ